MTTKIQNVYTNEPSQSAPDAVTISKSNTPPAPIVPDDMNAKVTVTVAESGGPGEDIFGTDSDDVLTGKEGDDGFLETKGNDTVDGGAGRNQIDYLGSSSEYAITRDGDTLTVVKLNGGTDTVTNVSGVYFFGDDVWKATSEFSAATDDSGDDSDDCVGDDSGSDDHPVDDGDDTTGGDATGGDNGFGGKDFFGTDDNDVLTGGEGNDGFLGSAGNDTIDGGEGYNQIDYAGSSSDYSVTLDGDTLTVVKPNGEGTDTVSNVSGVYFFGDDTWKAVEEFGADGDDGDDSADNVDSYDHPVDDVTDGGSDDAGDMTGGDNGFGGQDFFGTDGDDVLTGGDGNDGFLGYAGNDVIDGGEGYNQVDYTGSSTDYQAGIAADGSVTVIKPNGEGTDTLVNVDGIYFAGDDVWKQVSELGPIDAGEEQPVDGGDGNPVDGGGEEPVDETPVVDCPVDGGGEQAETYGTDGFDILSEDGSSAVYGYGSADLIFAGSGDAVLDGGEGFDVMHANGASTDYTFNANSDGSVTASSDVDGTDTMVDMEAVYFAGDDQFAMVSSLTGGGEAEVEMDAELSCF
ncbi:calcium-binding protein [Ahrensia sp. R2A130]|uniref:calcium-binding protein n=1 Tax=Ahrensia sp. R2A130 TaxID=744979 RepID=UPI0001E0CA0B|nr:hypothetical protein [Ahrensia sp. R2A130]EFL88823.1 hemolysin-type calcium-binding region [Ahrensia sp. R2A130]